MEKSEENKRQNDYGYNHWKAWTESNQFQDVVQLLSIVVIVCGITGLGFFAITCEVEGDAAWITTGAISVLGTMGILVARAMRENSSDKQPED